MIRACVLNQKGGVGKTSSCLLLTDRSRALGLRTLVIDLDAQGNASSALGVPGETAEFTAFEVIDQAKPGVAAAAAVESPTWPGVWVIPAHPSLATLNRSVDLAIEHRLRESLEGVTDWDLVLIDCPPAVDKLVASALVAADYALIVTHPSKWGLDGVAAVSETIETIQRFMNPSLEIAGAIINAARARTREATLRMAELRESLGATVWEPPIPHRQVVEDMAGAGAPLSEFGADALPVTRVVDVLLARLLWLDDSYRAAHPDRDPEALYASYLSWLDSQKVKAS